MEKERTRKRGLIEEGKRDRKSKRAHVIPECRKLKAPATRLLASSFFLSLANISHPRSLSFLSLSLPPPPTPLWRALAFITEAYDVRISFYEQQCGQAKS